MRLSEAILMNGMVRPQGQGVESMYSEAAPCALGGALQSIGKQVTVQDYKISAPYTAIQTAWPWTDKLVAPPWDKKTPFLSIVSIIWRLNDDCGWSRAAIAEWVATVEPADTESCDTKTSDVETCVSY